MLFQQSQAKRPLHPTSLKQQRGIVIVLALFIVALVATMSYVMMARLERDTRRTSLLLKNTEAELYAQGSIAWAMDQLKNDWEKQTPKTLIDVTPIKSPIKTMNHYQIGSVIYDMQARFNLNNLNNNQDAQKDFMHLLKIIQPNLTEENTQQILRAVLDWITPVTQSTLFDKYYLELPIPYRSAHRAMVSATELQLVKGMSLTLFNALKPYVTALPAQTPINIQSATAQVLATLDGRMTLDIAKSVELSRVKTPFISAEVFLNLENMKNYIISAQKMTVISRYFLVETEVSIEDQHTFLYTLVERITRDNKAIVNILWQSKSI